MLPWQKTRGAGRQVRFVRCGYFHTSLRCPPTVDHQRHSNFVGSSRGIILSNATNDPTTNSSTSHPIETTTKNMGCACWFFLLEVSSCNPLLFTLFDNLHGQRNTGCCFTGIVFPHLLSAIFVFFTTIQATFVIDLLLSFLGSTISFLVHLRKWSCINARYFWSKHGPWRIPRLTCSTSRSCTRAWMTWEPFSIVIWAFFSCKAVNPPSILPHLQKFVPILRLLVQ